MGKQGLRFQETYSAEFLGVSVDKPDYWIALE